MNPIELLYPLFKLQNSTDTRLYLVIIVTLLLFNLYVLKRMSDTESEMKAFVGFLITIVTIGVSVSLALNFIVPDNIKTDVKETSYQTVSTDWIHGTPISGNIILLEKLLPLTVSLMTIKTLMSTNILTNMTLTQKRQNMRQNIIKSL